MEIIGHKKQLKILNKAIEKQSVAGAYLFTGPEHVGKFTIALYLAEKILGKSTKANLDFYLLQPEIEEKKGVKKKKEIKIENIRDLENWFNLTTFGHGKKVAIIDEADLMNIATQNALLKNLEEPKTGVFIILVAHNERKLLPTIISRCRKINFGTVSDKEIKRRLGEKINEEIIFWSLGRPGLALNLIQDPNELEARVKAKKNLFGLFQKSMAEKLNLAEELSKNLEDLSRELNFWNLLLREKILGKLNQTNLDSKKSLELIEKISYSLKIIKETNTNAKLVLENLFLIF